MFRVFSFLWWDRLILYETRVDFFKYILLIIFFLFLFVFQGWGGFFGGMGGIFILFFLILHIVLDSGSAVAISQASNQGAQISNINIANLTSLPSNLSLQSLGLSGVSLSNLGLQQMQVRIAWKLWKFSFAVRHTFIAMKLSVLVRVPTN